jgi:hypothetical protein
VYCGVLTARHSGQLVPLVEEVPWENVVGHEDGVTFDVLLTQHSAAEVSAVAFGGGGQTGERAQRRQWSIGVCRTSRRRSAGMWPGQRTMQGTWTPAVGTILLERPCAAEHLAVVESGRRWCWRPDGLVQVIKQTPEVVVEVLGHRVIAARGQLVFATRGVRWNVGRPDQFPEGSSR